MPGLDNHKELNDLIYQLRKKIQSLLKEYRTKIDQHVIDDIVRIYSQLNSSTQKSVQQKAYLLKQLELGLDWQLFEFRDGQDNPNKSILQLVLQEIQNTTKKAREEVRAFEWVLNINSYDIHNEKIAQANKIDAQIKETYQMYRALQQDATTLRASGDVLSAARLDSHAREAEERCKTLSQKHQTLIAEITSIKEILPNKESRDLLYEGAFDEGKEETSARDAFLEYLDRRMQALEKQTDKPRPKITMDALLGGEDGLGLKLYEAATLEEGKSRAFRDAVFLQSTNYYAGPKWDKKMLLWVGGPSASGKTFGSSSAVKAMAKSMPHKEGDLSGNYVVSVDGGVEREVSQMRQMVLQAALSKGFSGIRDLHKKTHFTSKDETPGKRDIKDFVRAAAYNDPALSMVVPETFAESATTKRTAAHGALRENEMRTYHEDDRIVQAFAEVRSGGNNNRFQTSVWYMGNARAWFKDDKTFNESQIKMNNRDIGCESKSYSSNGFLLGKWASKKARDNLKVMDPHGWYINITNDLVFVRKTADGNWIECNGKDKPDAKLSLRDFQRWQKANKESPIDLKTWFEIQAANDDLAPAIILVEPNDVMELILRDNQTGSEVLFRVSQRDCEQFFENYPATKSQTVDTFIAWCSDPTTKIITPIDNIRAALEMPAALAESELEEISKNELEEQFQELQIFLASKEIDETEIKAGMDILRGLYKDADVSTVTIEALFETVKEIFGNDIFSEDSPAPSPEQTRSASIETHNKSISRTLDAMQAMPSREMTEASSLGGPITPRVRTRANQPPPPVEAQVRKSQPNIAEGAPTKQQPVGWIRATASRKLSRVRMTPDTTTSPDADLPRKKSNRK